MPSRSSRKRTRDDASSYLVKETDSMERNRRTVEQQGLRVLLQKKVHEREHHDNTETAALMNEDFGDGLEQHPLFDSQLFDGIDSNNSPDPYLNPTARTKIENKRRDQAREKQLRLENRLENQLTNVPRFNPTPKGP